MLGKITGDLEAAETLASKDKVASRVAYFCKKENNKYFEKFTQMNLTSLWGKSAQSVGYIFRGEQNMTLQEVAKFAELMGVTTDEVILGRSLNSGSKEKKELAEAKLEIERLRGVIHALTK